MVSFGLFGLFESHQFGLLPSKAQQAGTIFSGRRVKAWSRDFHAFRSPDAVSPTASKVIDGISAGAAADGSPGTNGSIVRYEAG